MVDFRRALGACALTAMVAGLRPALADDRKIMDAFCCHGGATAIITTKGGDGVPCYFQTDDMEKAVSAAAEKDSYGFADATNGKSVMLAAGEHVRFLDNKAGGLFSNVGGAVKMRIESGPNARVGCWVPGYLKGVVKDIRGESN
ncbi:MAG: hypothetical protein WB681_14500 [Candidatus Cybelea sp.]